MAIEGEVMTVMGVVAMLGAWTGLLMGVQEPPKPAKGEDVVMREVRLEAGLLEGTLRDNVANAQNQGSGFTPLIYRVYPKCPIYRPEHVGLNFEHVFNGAAVDKSLSMFTPRKDVCRLVRHSERSASIVWSAHESSWDMDCEMMYTFVEPSAIDTVFSVTPRSERSPLGYVAFMWASYMNRTRERRIHFLGRDGDTTGWISFGDATGDGFETGTVACDGVEDLPYEEGAETLNLIEHPSKKFIKPFYYGLIDGDHDLGTEGDVLAYVVMFDQRETIRFAEWNFIKDAQGMADPHSPAWDWQYVIREPHVGQPYGYRARVEIRPFTTKEAIEQRYEAWRASLQP